MQAFVDFKMLYVTPVIPLYGLEFRKLGRSELLSASLFTFCQLPSNMESYKFVHHGKFRTSVQSILRICSTVKTGLTVQLIENKHAVLFDGTWPDTRGKKNVSVSAWYTHKETKIKYNLYMSYVLSQRPKYRKEEFSGYIKDIQLSWMQAHKTCQVIGGMLPYFLNRQDFYDLIDFVKHLHKQQDKDYLIQGVFIGLNRNKVGIFNHQMILLDLQVLKKIRPQVNLHFSCRRNGDGQTIFQPHFFLSITISSKYLS